MVDAPIEPIFPHYTGRNDDAPELQRLVGSTIVSIGTVRGGKPEDGGLMIEFLRPGETKAERISLEFSELGMWLS